MGSRGGLNLYGFASGDPVNFSDPFGLCGPFTPVCVWLLANLPALTVVGVEAATGLAVGGKLTGAALRQAGKAGEAAVEAGLLSEGTRIVGKQVSANTSAGRRVIDFLVQRADETLVAIEAKSGGAVRNASQLRKDQSMASEGAVLVGKNAPEGIRNVALPPIFTEVRRP